jgi:hypothetical protein
MRSLYEWQVKDLKQLCFQRLATNLYEWQTKDLQRWDFCNGHGSGVNTLRSESERLVAADLDWQTHLRVPVRHTICQLLY